MCRWPRTRPSIHNIPKTCGPGWTPSARPGNELLCISHNANLSNGLMFPMDVDSKGRPIDAAWAAERLNNELLTEIKQVKGTSETTPELSPTDEFASFELMNYLIGLDNSHSNPHGSYAREAYKNGLAMQDTRGYNPYKFGFVGAGDSHNTATAYSQSNYFGDHAMIDPTPEDRLSGKVVVWYDDHTDRDLRAGWRVGGGEHAGVDLRRHEAQGNLWHLRRSY